MPQTNYTLYQPVGYAGMIAAANYQDVHTYKSQFNDTIPYGVVVVKGTADKTVTMPSGANRNAVGVAVFRGDQEMVGGYLLNDDMNVMKKGSVYMIAEAAVTADAPVYFRHTAEASPTAVQGIGRVTGTTSANHEQLLGARAKRSASAGQVVEVLLNMPA